MLYNVIRLFVSLVSVKHMAQNVLLSLGSPDLMTFNGKWMRKALLV